MMLHRSYDVNKKLSSRPCSSVQKPTETARFGGREIPFPRSYNNRAIGLATNLHKNHEAVQPVGVAKQDPILLHEAESWLPMLVFLMVTQKTNTTKSTIKAYSTSPWPSSSTNSLFKSSTYLTPFLLKIGTRRVVVSFPCPTRADIMTAQPSSTNYATAKFQ